MPVYFFIPDQYAAWEDIDRNLMAKRASYSRKVLDDMWESGLLHIHEMATEKGPFGYLVLARFDLGLKPFLHVMYCQVKPRKALREDQDWLKYAVEYLKETAAQVGCAEVRIVVAEDHPNPSWRWRLLRNGFSPTMTEMSISVAA